MQRDVLISLSDRLRWGAAATRRDLAAELAHAGEWSNLMLLASTIRSTESWQLRARCLEVLGLVAGQADRQLAEDILQALMETDGGTDHV